MMTDRKYSGGTMTILDKANANKDERRKGPVFEYPTDTSFSCATWLVVLHIPDDFMDLWSNFNHAELKKRIDNLHE